MEDSINKKLLKNVVSALFILVFILLISVLVLGYKIIVLEQEAKLFLEEGSDTIKHVEEGITIIENDIAQKTAQTASNIEMHAKEFTEAYINRSLINECEFKTNNMVIRGNCANMQALISLEILDKYSKSMSQTIKEATESMDRLGFSKEEQQQFAEQYFRAISTIASDISVQPAWR